MITVDAAKERLLTDRIGPFRQLSADEALKMALDCEQTAKDCGPFDPAYSHFIQKSLDWLTAATLIERTVAAA